MFSYFQKDGSRGIALLLLTLLLVTGIQSCNQEPISIEQPESNTNEDFEKSIKQTSDMFRIASRISSAHVERNFVNIDKGMQEQLVNKFGKDASLVYQSVKKEVFGKVNNERIKETISAIAKNNAKASRSSRVAAQQMGELMSSVKNEMMVGSNVSPKVKSYIDRVAGSFAFLAQEQMSKIRESVQKIDGVEFIPSGIYDAKDLANNLNKEILKIEKDVMNDKDLSEESKKGIYQYNATILGSSSDLSSYCDNLSNPISIVKNGRVAGWFSKLVNVFRSVIAIVVTIVIVAAAVVTAIYCPPCIAAAASFLGVAALTAGLAAAVYAAAIVTGFVVGAYVGVEVGYAIVCSDPIDEAQCYDCVNDAVTLGGIPFTSFIGNAIFDCDYCEGHFYGFRNRNQGLCY